MFIFNDSLINFNQDPSTQSDPQYMFLRERLKALKDGWDELRQMWENRQDFLSQNLNLQIFMRDAKQAEVLLSQQEHILSKDETPVSAFTFFFKHIDAI
jgi:spectrin beta